MLNLRFAARTPKAFAQFQADLNRAIDESFAAAMTTRQWNERTLHTAAPATRGCIRFDAGAVYAEVWISLPALPAKQVIVAETRRILAKASGGPVSTVK